MPRPLTAALPPYAGRLAGLRADMAAKKLDGFLVWNRFDQIWLTGFAGEDGGVLVTDDTVTLLTDGRFGETADIEAPFARKAIRKVRGPEATVKEVRREKITRLGFEPNHLSVRTYAELRKLFASATKLVTTEDLISRRRRIKDAGEVQRIRAAIRVAEDAMKRLLGWMNRA